MIKREIKNIIKKAVSPVFNKELDSIKSIAAVYQRIMEHNTSDGEVPDLSCEGIVFSKNRAMQLHALLSSYFSYVKNPVKLYILYTADDERHFRSYNELKKLFADKEIVFIKEKKFKADLENLLESIRVSKIFFMTDDGLFIDTFDMHEVLRFNPITTVATLIKGLDLTYCYMQDKEQKLPEFFDSPDLLLPSYMKCWEWGKAESGFEWAYPLSVDTTFFNKKEIQLMIENISYKGPNSLETSLHNAYAPVFLLRKGVCYNKAKYVNIVCNIVNTEHKNRNTGLHSAESLLNKWEEGYRIKYENFFGKNCADAEKSFFEFEKRTLQ